ncbi:MAG: hypothetical protein K2N22_04110 [Clostridia bacterium]|nr:hypothetical protein [Clostridia bacterium]
MRVYWLIEGLDKPLYTAKAARLVKDKETGKEYKLGKMVALKKSNAPKILAEDTGKYEFYRRMEEVHYEKAGLFRKRKVVTKAALQTIQKELTGIQYFWIIDGYSPKTYTKKACDLVRDKATGKTYKRGDFVKFADEEYPFPLAEHTDNFDFIYDADSCSPMTQEDYMGEIWVNTLFGKGK